MESRKPYLQSQKGFSLVELMIAMVLGLLLLVGVVNIFLGSNQTYRLQEAMFQMQEAGRFSISIMTRDVRDAGFQNVLPINVTRTTNIEAVRGYQIADAGRPASVVTSVSSEIFYINTHDGDLAGDIAYYIATDVSGSPALFRNGDAIVESVEGLVVEYGRDLDGDRQVDQFDLLAAIPATGWSDVVAVRVNIYVASGPVGLLETAKPAMPAPFGAIDTSDRRLYQPFTTTIALRNKIQ